MKIEKLYTSLEFGLYLKSLTSKELCDLTGAPIPTPKEGAAGFFRLDAIMLGLRNDWDKFLLQPLKEEMFVNDMGEKPEATDETYVDWMFWKEAERKVIFEGWKKSIHFAFDLCNHSIDGCWDISFKNADFPSIIGPSNGTVKTLHDLAEATKSTLTLKKIEL